MGPSFTRGEYWLLETVVESRSPLCFLAARQVGDIYNKPGHGLGRDELVETLVRLFERGLIDSSEIPRDDDSPRIRLERREIERALLERPPSLNSDCTYYGLTDEGGRQWEAFAAPCWRNYLAHWSRSPRSGSWSVGTVICPKKWIVDRWLEGAHSIGYKIDHSHIHRKIREPWEATYWKTLELGYEATFRFEESSGASFEHAPHWFVALHENRWYRWQ